MGCHFGYHMSISLFKSKPPLQSICPVNFVLWGGRWNALESSLNSRLGLSSLTSQLTWAFWLVWILLCLLTGKSKGGKGGLCSKLFSSRSPQWKLAFSRITPGHEPIVKAIPCDSSELLCSCLLPFFFFHGIFVELSEMTECHHQREQIPSDFNKRDL